jgi:F-type H+-transporting ATPase subunit b
MEILGLSIWEFIFTIINFIVLLILLKKFLYKPILKMLDQRKASIDEALTAADNARMEVASTEENLRNEIANAKSQAEDIVFDAKKNAERVQADIIASASDEAKSIADEATEQIAKEKTEAIAQLRSEIADLAILATQKVLSEGLTKEQEKELLEKYVKEVGRLQ